MRVRGFSRFFKVLCPWSLKRRQHGQSPAAPQECPYTFFHTERCFSYVFKEVVRQKIQFCTHAFSIGELSSFLSNFSNVPEIKKNHYKWLYSISTSIFFHIHLKGVSKSVPIGVWKWNFPSFWEINTDRPTNRPTDRQTEQRNKASHNFCPICGPY